LDSFEHINASLDEIGEEVEDGAIGVEHDSGWLDTGMKGELLRQTEESLVVGHDHLAVGIGGEEQTVLTAEVVGEVADVNAFSDEGESEAKLRFEETGDAVESGLDQLGFEHQVGEGTLVTGHPGVDLEGVTADVDPELAGETGMGIDGVELAGETGVIEPGGVGPGISGDIGGGGGSGEGIVLDLIVRASAVGNRSAHYAPDVGARGEGRTDVTRRDGEGVLGGEEEAAPAEIPLEEVSAEDR